ncbi:putative dsRNA-binding protein [Streptomyces malaysiensis]|uniref:DsRNA-binding protein n=1 Tax=Streptomyces malaysiensis subsp. samsunensis TaxID=459658 RepID=A0A9X2M6R0_STRMQ|nr:putative dsRNA-binding protein [Streptomyces samsunensis]MCQ8836527.1 putative dsRNA-binding protein [Streptomyces samsunensis]
MNRWVGIVSLRETPPPTPVHRIALAIEAARNRTSYQLAGQTVPYARMRSALRTLGQEHARHHEWERYAYCVDLAGDFFDGGLPPTRLPSWLTNELQNLLNNRSSTPPTGGRRAQTAPRRTTSRPSHQRPASSRQGRSTLPEARRPARPAQPASPEPVWPYSRAERRLDVHDVTYPALCEPPVSLVGTYEREVREFVEKAVPGWNAGPEVTAWLGLAAEHRSHLYESHHTEQVTPHVLGLLDRLGANALDVILLDAYARWATPRKSGEQSSEHARRRAAAELALGVWVTERGLARMGAGEAQQPARSVFAGVARQILGVLSLWGEHEVARRLVVSVWPDIDRPSAETGVDPGSLAQMAFRKEGLAYEYREEGPDHRKVFRVVVRTGTGRTAEGTGQSKKAARAAAARALLDAYPQVAVAAGAGPKAAPATVLTASPLPYPQPGNRHRHAVSDLATMFELGHRADGLLAQALTHASWVHENQAAATAARQRDNQLLAHHGSHVVDYLVAHARARQALAHGLTPDEDEARILTSSDDDTARLGADLQLAEGLLTSRGESGQGRTTVSDAAQAIIAAAWRVHGSRLLGRRPAALDDWLSGLEHQHDPATVLAAMATTYGIDHEYTYDVSGPDHLKSYTATIRLRDAQGRAHQWTERLPGTPGKPEAKKGTAEAVLDILATPVSGVVDDLPAPERDLLVFLLRAQLNGLGWPTERQRARMLARGDLGTDLLTTGDTKAFLAWAERVRPLLGPDDTAVPDTLRELYQKVLHDMRIGPGSLLRRMAAAPGPDAASVVRRNAADAVRRALSSGPQAASVRDIVQEWWREQAPTTGVTVRDDMRQEVFQPLPAHLGALDETLTWCGEAAEAANTRIDVELTVQNSTLHVWLGLDKVDVQATCDDFARLLSHALPHTDCLVGDDHVLLRLHGGLETAPPHPLATAGMDAYISGPLPRQPLTEEAVDQPTGAQDKQP